MRKLLVLLAVIVLAGCASALPTTETPTNTPEPTNVSRPTNAPDPNAIVSDFIYDFKDNFQFFINQSVIELTKFAFEYDNESDLHLLLETKSGEALIQNQTTLAYSISVLSNELEDGPRLPVGIKEVWFTLRNKDLEIRKQFILDWEVLLDYIENDITEDQLLASIQTP